MEKPTQARIRTTDAHRSNSQHHGHSINDVVRLRKMRLPLILLFGQSPSQLQKAWALGKRLQSKPTSDNSTDTLKNRIPRASVKSIPKICLSIGSILGSFVDNRPEVYQRIGPGVYQRMEEERWGCEWGEKGKAKG